MNYLFFMSKKTFKNVSRLIKESIILTRYGTRQISKPLFFVYFFQLFRRVPLICDSYFLHKIILQVISSFLTEVEIVKFVIFSSSFQTLPSDTSRNACVFLEVPRRFYLMFFALTEKKTEFSWTD